MVGLDIWIVQGTIQMADLRPYLRSWLSMDLRSNPLQEGEDDRDPSIQHSLGPQIN